MANQIFNFPGFFDREIDLTDRQQEPVGIPAGVVGAAEKGPAFVPLTVGSFADFRSRFGNLNPRLVAPYSVDRYLDNKSALTFVRVLGAGSNETTADIDTTRVQGTVKNAGFVVSGAAASSTPTNKAEGAVQFIVARHSASQEEALGFPMFSQNQSYDPGSQGEVYLTRGVLFMASSSRAQILDLTQEYSSSTDDLATPVPANTVNSNPSGSFKIAISSSTGPAFGNDDGNPGIRIFTASLDPASDSYFAKILNTDPERFAEEQHLVYADFAVDESVANLMTATASIGLASGSANTSSTSGNTSLAFQEAFGRFDTRFKTPHTPWFISQPYGDAEHNLFRFEAIDDGAYANQRIKVSIANIQKSANPKDKHATFNVQVRAFDDTDLQPQILEQFNNVNLNPDSEDYIARKIGDKRAFFNFDSPNEEDRRLVTRGKFPNRSRNIRVIMAPEVEEKKIPEDAAPFGYRGVEVLNTNSLLKDSGSSGISRLALSGNLSGTERRLSGSIVPPLPYRFKVTRGEVDTAGNFTGEPGATEIADARFYWGVKTTRNDSALNPNVSSRINKLVSSYTKFLGIEKLDTLVTGSQKDKFNNNKFTLARVALSGSSIGVVNNSPVNQNMKSAAYIRNGSPDSFDYTITDGGSPRVTLATLYQSSSVAADFNRFSNFTKFTSIMFGGFDGTNILDKNAATFSDRATSTEVRSLDSQRGNASSTFTSPGLRSNVNGVGVENSTIFSYRRATDIITDSINSNINLLAVPGQREPLVTDYIADSTKDFGIALYSEDIPNYDSDGNRIWDGDSGFYVGVESTANAFEQRALDNEFAAAYFPNFIMEDNVNRRRVKVPASVAALSALGFNDRVAFPWFAPAGFNRAALDFVERTEVRINQDERERLFATHINPIVKFPREGFVIFAQNTLEQAETALGKINVIRMLNNIKRQIISIGNRSIFEQITPALRENLANSFRNVLNTVTARAGIERFEVIADERNNTQTDVENNQVNVRIVLVPTRAAEFIALDFIITRSGVQFV